MTPLNSLSVAQLREAVAIKEQIERLETQLASVFGETTMPEVAGKKRRRMSAAGRARMAAAARARWAKIKGTQATPTKKRRKNERRRPGADFSRCQGQMEKGEGCRKNLSLTGGTTAGRRDQRSVYSPVSTVRRMIQWV